MGAKYKITPYSRTLPDSCVDLMSGRNIGDEITKIIQWNFVVMELSSLFRNLPKGQFSLLQYPTITPLDPLPEVVSLVKEIESPRLIVAGHHLAKGRLHQYYSKKGICERFNDLNLGERLLIQGHANNTAEQAVWVADQVLEYDIKAIVLITASWHLARAFSTQLMAFVKNGIEIPIIPIPHATNFKGITNFNENHEEDEGNIVSQEDLHLGEAVRLLEYSNKEVPDVASIEMIQEYASWLSKCPYFKNL